MTGSHVDEFTSGERATELMQRAGLEVHRAEPSYVRYKPGETALVAYRLTLADRSVTFGYVRWCHAVDRADDVFAKALALRPRSTPIGPGVVRLDGRAILYVLPNDARLRRLRWYTEPRKLKRTLGGLVQAPGRVSARRSSVAVIRYKPERRIVNRVRLATDGNDVTDLLVRYSASRHASALHESAHHLRRYGVRVPTPIAALEGDRVSVDEWLPGETLLDAVENDRADPAALADALERLHATPARVGAPVRSVDEELTRTTIGLAGLSLWRPQIASVAATVCDRLRNNVPSRSSCLGLVHGDLHAKNLLVHEGAISFIDLERVATGPKAIDLGFLRAHALAQPLRCKTTRRTGVEFADEVVDRYDSYGPGFDRHELDWHTAVGLVDQALLTIRHLEPGSDRSAYQLLELAAAMATPAAAPAKRIQL